MSSPPEPVNLVEACRAQMAACRELIYARELLNMAQATVNYGDGDLAPHLARYRRALAAAQEATRVSDQAQSRARCELPPADQPELFP